MEAKDPAGHFLGQVKQNAHGCNQVLSVIIDVEIHEKTEKVKNHDGRQAM
jgi:hypothetical protein